MLTRLMLLLPALAVSTYPNLVDHSVVFPDGAALSSRSQTGYLPLSANSDVFYWLFMSDADNASTKPTIVWIQGQIGVSSLFGVINEFTPAWLDSFNVVFVDAPLGTGFSTAGSEDDLANTSEDVAAQVVQFLSLFFDRHGADVGNDVIIGGEDYAGHTIPVIASLIHRESKRGGTKYNLHGTAVGNGHTHAPIQVITKAESAAIFGLVDGPCLTEARGHAWAASVMSVAGDTMGSLHERNLLEQTILNCSNGVDMANIARAISKTDPTLMDAVQDWMNNKTLTSAIGVRDGESAVAKNGTVLAHLDGDIMRVIWGYIPPILEAGIPMLWYQGQLDWVDGVYSNEAWINALDWSGADAYSQVRRTDFDGGYARSYGPLTEAMIRGTGHLAIREQPDVVLGLFKTAFLDDNIPSAANPEQLSVIVM